MFLVFYLLFVQITASSTDEFFCKNIQLILDKQKSYEFFVTTSEGRIEKHQDELDTLNKMLQYLNTVDEANACNGTKTGLEDICSYIAVVKGNIDEIENLIQSQEHVVEKYTDLLAELESQLEFLNTFDLAGSCR